jgi:hypothetical protein
MVRLELVRLIDGVLLDEEGSGCLGSVFTFVLNAGLGS